MVWVALIFLVACTTTAEDAGNGNGTMGHMDDQAMGGTEQHGGMMGEHIHGAVPDEYADLVNPLAEDEAAMAAAIIEGQANFTIYCVSCHGEGGQGDGVAAEALDPKPANLADGTMMMDMGDNYLFWRISEGGAMEPFNSAMPAWKNSLSEEQIWQVVSYVRALSEQ